MGFPLDEIASGRCPTPPHRRRRDLPAVRTTYHCNLPPVEICRRHHRRRHHPIRRRRLDDRLRARSYALVSRLAHPSRPSRGVDANTASARWSPYPRPRPRAPPRRSRQPSAGVYPRRPRAVASPPRRPRALPAPRRRSHRACISSESITSRAHHRARSRARDRVVDAPCEDPPPRAEARSRESRFRRCGGTYPDVLCAFADDVFSAFAVTAFAGEGAGTIGGGSSSASSAHVAIARARVEAIDADGKARLFPIFKGL